MNAKRIRLVLAPFLLLFVVAIVILAVKPRPTTPQVIAQTAGLALNDVPVDLVEGDSIQIVVDSGLTYTVWSNEGRNADPIPANFTNIPICLFYTSDRAFSVNGTRAYDSIMGHYLSTVWYFDSHDQNMAAMPADRIDVIDMAQGKVRIAHTTAQACIWGDVGSTAGFMRGIASPTIGILINVDQTGCNPSDPTYEDIRTLQNCVSWALRH